MPISKYAFPNATTVAEFRPHSLTLHFHESTRQQFADSLSRSQKVIGDCEIIQTLYHELTHWSDCVSSVWGQHYINRLFKTFDVIDARDETDFYKYVSFFDEDRRIMFPRYYHVIEAEERRHGPALPWRISFSCGQEFDAQGKIDPTHPIFFVSFEDNISKKRIARQPISIGALLETTAVWAELIVSSLVLRAYSPEEGAIERRLEDGRRLKALYNKDLTLYSAPAHMLAHFCGVSDLIWTYERSALLASVALNMTPSHFSRLRHPKRFEPFGSRRKSFVRAENRGYAYAALAAHAGDIDKEPSNLGEWLGATLSAADLPSYYQLCKDAAAHLKIFTAQHTKSDKNEIVRQTLLQVGKERCEARMARSSNLTNFEPFGLDDSALPLLFDADGEVFAVGDKVIPAESINPTAMLSFEYKIDDEIQNFLQGCRGLE